MMHDASLAADDDQMAPSCMTNVGQDALALRDPDGEAFMDSCFEAA